MESIKAKVFETIYNDLIIKIGETIAENFSLSFSPNFDTAFNEYQKQKTLFRLLCNKLSYTENSCDLLDRHKVCAALCVSILNCNFLSGKEKISDENHNLNQFKKFNEQLAISVSLDLLKAFLKAEQNDEKDEKKMFPDDNFIFPTPLNNEEQYEDTIVRTLYFANTVGQTNLHLIAHIFFLIEQYHLLKISKNQK